MRAENSLKNLRHVAWKQRLTGVLTAAGVVAVPALAAAIWGTSVFAHAGDGERVATVAALKEAGTVGVRQVDLRSVSLADHSPSQSMALRIDLAATARADESVETYLKNWEYTQFGFFGFPGFGSFGAFGSFGGFGGFSGSGTSTTSDPSSPTELTQAQRDALLIDIDQRLAVIEQLLFLELFFSPFRFFSIF